MISACVRLDFYKPWILSPFRSKQRLKKWYLFLLIVDLRSQKEGCLCCCGYIRIVVFLWLCCCVRVVVVDDTPTVLRLKKIV